MLVLLAGLWQTSASPASDTLRALARDGPESLLVERARRQPDDVRDVLRQLFHACVTETSDVNRAQSLTSAERIASAYSIAWGDSFLIRQVVRFQSLTPTGRTAKVAADSARLAGNTALARAGPNAAMRAWRESLRRFEALTDTAGIAAALGNLGAGFYLAQAYDSAEAYLTRSRDLADAIGDYRTAGNAVGTLANVSKDRGDLRRASDLFTRARALRERTGDARGLAADQNNLGFIDQRLGDLDGARHAFAAALAANRAAGRAVSAATNLINLGNIASLTGDYAEAADRYDEALAAYRASGDQPDIASALHHLGLLDIQRGDYAAAMATLAEAAGIYRHSGPAAQEIAVRRDLADARAAAGDLHGARSELGRAEALGVSASLALARADLAVQFNELPEAERQYARAEVLAAQGGDQDTRAAAQQGKGILLLLRERYAGAQTALALALRTQDALPDHRAAAQTRLLLGYAQRQLGDLAAARRSLSAALDSLQALGDVGGEATALGALADLEAQGGLGLTAESLYQRGLSRVAERRAPGVTWRLHAGLAEALQSRGALSQAAVELNRAIGDIERVSAGLPVPERRAAFLADKWDVYARLAEVEMARGHRDSAFAVSERLRARQLLDLLARGRLDAGTAARPELVNREQDLRRQIAELTQRVVNVPKDAPSADLRGPAASDPAAAATLERLSQAEDAYGELLIQMQEANPPYATLVRGTMASTRDVQQALASDEALLEYLVGDSTTDVFVITADSIVALDLNVSHATLEPLVDFARGTLANPRVGAAGDAWRAPLRRLYGYLVAPVEQTRLLSGKHRLLIAPHGELHYLPFAALVQSGPAAPLLIDRYVVSYVPSASVWLQLRARPAPAARGIVLALAPRADVLPGSRSEVTAIGRLYGERAQVLTGSSATEHAFRTLAPGHDIVHLATYGVLNKHNPLFSFVDLGAGGGDDGRLEVHEVFGLNLNARLLVLSACQTGVAAGAQTDVPSGDDWVGLVQAFLAAGASNVMATLWPVEDVATSRLMGRFYQELSQGRDEADALAESQRAAAHDPRTAHPFYWAGFALVTGR